MKTVLLLAGTTEARALAAAFQHPDCRMIASLAGVTTAPRAYPCQTRIGGFGGVEGLLAYLENDAVAAIVDATHPFATGMSDHAAKAAAARQIPCLALIRPEWSPQSNWTQFSTLDDAVAALPAGSRVFATTGRKDTAPLIARRDLTTILRSVDPPEGLPPHIIPIAARGPFSIESEKALMHTKRITHLVTRNSGGDSRQRLDAAFALGLPVHIVDRPPRHAANVAYTVADALQWLEAVLRD